MNINEETSRIRVMMGLNEGNIKDTINKVISNLKLDNIFKSVQDSYDNNNTKFANNIINEFPELNSHKNELISKVNELTSMSDDDMVNMFNRSNLSDDPLDNFNNPLRGVGGIEKYMVIIFLFTYIKKLKTITDNKEKRIFNSKTRGVKKPKQ